MKLFRASRLPRAEFDPLDSSRSVARDGWRFNDRRIELLYAAGVEALALLEVVVRPGWDTVREITVATVDVPDGAIARLDDLGITLPRNWNSRPVARDSQAIGAAFLRAVDDRAVRGAVVCGVWVPSVISSSDSNVLLDPRQKASYRVSAWARIPFETLRSTHT